MQKGCGEVVLQLDYRHHQRVDQQIFPSHQGPVPFEFAELSKAEFVREVSSLVTFLVMLVLVECQGICGVLVLICLEVILHTCKNI